VYFDQPTAKFSLNQNWPHANVVRLPVHVVLSNKTAKECKKTQPSKANYQTQLSEKHNKKELVILELKQGSL
jgi:hypothetical protein